MSETAPPTAASDPPLQEPVPCEPATSGPREPPSTFGQRVRDGAWVSTTYFGEGFPYSVVNNLAEVLFTQLDAGLGLIGLTSLFHLPWNLKFLWAPFVDQYETKRRWLLGIEVALVAGLALVALAVGSGELGLVAAAFAVVAVLSATHDITIDGYYLEALDDRGQQAFVGFRAMAYKLASLLVRGPLLVLVAAVGWAGGMWAATAVMGLLLTVHVLLLPAPERRLRRIGELGMALLRPKALAALAVLSVLGLVEWQLAPLGRVWSWLDGVGVAPALRKVPTSGWIVGGLLVALALLALFRSRLRRRMAHSHYAAAFASFMEQPRVGAVLAFIILFRTGESFLQKMKSPFFLKELGLGVDAYGLLNGTFGVIASITGTIVGGWLIARHGLKRWVWPFVLAQNVLHLLYVALALSAGSGPPSAGAIGAVVVVEHFGEGLGTAVLMSYLIRCCHPRHRAAHMAILTALMSVSFTVAGVASGFLAAALGYATYFGFTFLVTVPGMLLIFVAPYLDGTRNDGPLEGASGGVNRSA